MMKSLVAPIVALALLTTACAPKSRAAAGSMLVGGTVAALAGGSMMVDLQGPGVDSDGDGRDEFPDKDLACALGGCLTSVLLMAAGAALMVSGGMGLAREEYPAAAPQHYAPAPTQHVRPITRIALPLPLIACDQETLRLAQQARALTQLGHCDAAHQATALIRKRNLSYYDALVVSPALSSCYQL